MHHQTSHNIFLSIFCLSLGFIISFPTICLATIMITRPFLTSFPTPVVSQLLSFGCSAQINLPSTYDEINFDKFHAGFNPLVISSPQRERLSLDLNFPIGNLSTTLIERSISDYILKYGVCIAFVTISSSPDLTSLLKIIHVSKLANGHQHVWYFGFLISTNEELEVQVQECFRSPMFRIKHPKVVLIAHQQTHRFEVSNSTLDQLNLNLNYKWTIICYLCPGSQTEWITGYPKNVQQIETLYMSLNGQGYGAKVESPAEGSWNHLNLEEPGFIQWNQSSVIGIFRGLIYKRFNFSLVEPSSLSFISTPRLMICMRCNISSIMRRTSVGQRLLAILYENKYHHLYCQKRTSLQSSSLTFFLRPFDTATWICILICSLLAGLKIKSIWGSLDVLWTLIGIPNQYRWSIGISILFFLLLLPQQLYIAYFTSDVLAPLKIQRFESNKELFMSGGFKVIDTTELNLKRQYRNMDLSKFGLEFSNLSFLVDNEPKFCGRRVAWYDCVAHWSDLGTRQIEPKFASHDIERIRQKNPKLHCDIVLEPFIESDWITIQLDGHLQHLVAEYVGRLLQGGFNEFWDSIYLVGIEHEGHSSSPEIFTYAKLSFNTALTSVFKLYDICICGAIVIFVCEILINKFFSRISCKKMIREFGEWAWVTMKWFLSWVLQKVLAVLNNCLNILNIIIANVIKTCTYFKIVFSTNSQ